MTMERDSSSCCMRVRCRKLVWMQSGFAVIEANSFEECHSLLQLLLCVEFHDRLSSINMKCQAAQQTRLQALQENSLSSHQST